MVKVIVLLPIEYILGNAPTFFEYLAHEMPVRLTWIWLVAAIKGGAVGPSEARWLQQTNQGCHATTILALNTCLSSSKLREYANILVHYIIIFNNIYSRNSTHNFAKTPLELDIGLTWMVDVGLTVFTPQSKLVVHYERNEGRPILADSILYITSELWLSCQNSSYVQTIMRAQTSQNFGFLQ